jgi:putative copper resistance protein D
LVGVSPGSLTVGSVEMFISDLAAGRAALTVLVIVGVLALAVRRCRNVVTARLLLVLALSGLVVPAVLTGHAVSAGNHAVAATTLAVHVVAASVWIGGLLALVLHGRGREDLAPASSRFSAVALACFVATGASGVLAAVIMVGGVGSVAGAMGTGYGWLLAGKTGALIALGACGWSHRRRTLPRVREGLPGCFRRLVAVEVAVMLATVAMAVALAGSPPPPATDAPAAVEREVASAPADDMSAHDHGVLSVGVLVDENRFHVSGPVSPGSRVTVHNRSTSEVTLTASGGAFDVVVPASTLLTFEAPDEPGSYPFASRHSRAFGDVLVVR